MPRRVLPGTRLGTRDGASSTGDVCPSRGEPIMNRSYVDSLYRRLFHSLNELARAALKNHADAEDVVHDAFVALLEEATGAPPEGPRTDAWLYGKVARLCRDRAPKGFTPRVVAIPLRPPRHTPNRRAA
jgi:DNA-directed RNA polymerase specialized sigma24 family protein